MLFYSVFSHFHYWEKLSSDFMQIKRNTLYGISLSSLIRELRYTHPAALHTLHIILVVVFLKRTSYVFINIYMKLKTKNQNYDFRNQDTYRVGRPRTAAGVVC
jgi:hypothetical protein